MSRNPFPPKAHGGQRAKLRLRNARGKYFEALTSLPTDTISTSIDEGVPPRPKDYKLNRVRVRFFT